MKIRSKVHRLALPLTTMLVLLSCRGEPPSSREHGAEHPGREDQHGEGRIELPAEAVDAASIKTAPVTSQALAEEIRATAVIKPNEYRLAHVSPRIAAKAIEVRAVLGSMVELGETLALLDSLELGEKKAAFLQSRTNLDVARRNYEREARLFKQQISSEKEYLEAKGEFERSDAAYRAAREALRLLGLTDEQIDRIAWGARGHPLSHFPLLAPFAGTIVEQHMTIGELVRPEDKPYTIADLTTVWVVLDIYERDLGRVSRGAEVRVSVDAYPDDAFAGKVTYLGNLVEPGTRAAQARVEIDNRDGKLRPGMFATATLSLPPHQGAKATVVPRDAVQQVRGRPVAFVEEKPGIYVARELKLGRGSSQYVEVLAGLAEGERVVSQGAFYLKSTLLKEEIGGEE
jgi:cobalt-zinc-cadmium efflux system membrane fusion protein